MINRLRRKFILISAASAIGVALLVFSVMTAFNVNSMNKTVDALADSVSSGGGRFPDFFDKDVKPERPDGNRRTDLITPETKFSTRYFTVWIDGDGKAVRVNTEAIASVTDTLAVEYANRALDGGKSRGWISNYRYKVTVTDAESEIVFIDGTMNKVSLFQTVTVSAVVLFSCAAAVLLLTVLLSKRTVRPVAESYEKQKQFITDANHELKTPLTLILANVDIVEAEIGKNEWLDDIRAEGARMTELVDRLVLLSRMDEERRNMNVGVLPLGEIVSDISSEFMPLAAEKGKVLSVKADRDVSVRGDAALISRLVSVLLDNAVKYCDAGGDISVSLTGTRRAVLTVENSYREVDGVELDRLFDRFYRADKARSFTGGYGIGLSIAKAIMEKHNGEITAYKKDGCRIGFKAVFKERI